MPNEPLVDALRAPGRTQIEVERILRATAEEIRDAETRQRGSVPAALARYADSLLEPAKIPWTSKLARVTRYAVGYRSGAVTHRYDAPGRRQAGIGFGPGRPIMPRLRTPIPNVTVIVDTSGSMSPKDLGAAARETSGILKALGAHVTLTVCDAEVHGLKKVDTIEQVLGMLTGGGGTDMRPAFAAALKQRPRPDVIICITDGHVGDGFPQQAPQGVRTVVVLVGDNPPKPAAWCECVAVD